MDIVTCTDHNFIMPTGVMMQSVCVNNLDSPINFHIISDESLTEKDKEDLNTVISKFANKDLFFYIVDGNMLSDMPALNNTYVTKATYYRLELARLLPESVDKALYLDGDIIVRESLADLWYTDISKYALAAVPDNNTELDLRSGYFNAGVMLINLNYWRAHKLNKLFYDYIHNNSEKIKFHDQDVLNSVLKDQKLLLPVKYNLSCGWLWKVSGANKEEYISQSDDAINDPVIIHYTTGNKPWNKGCRHPYRHIFLNYKSQTIWKNTPLIEDRPLKLRISKFFSGILRKFKLIPEIPYGKEYLPGLKQLE